MGDQGDAMMRSQNAAVQARTKSQNRANVMQLKLVYFPLLIAILFADCEFGLSLSLIRVFFWCEVSGDFD